MQVRRAFRQFAAPRFILASFSIVVFFVLALFPSRASAQEPGQEGAEEIVANLCTGRVVIGVAKDGIVVATLENPIEPQTRPPMIVPISDDRVAVLLGAADWWLPDQNREIARLDQELPDLPPPHGLATMPHLQLGGQEGAGSEATDIESLADRLRSRLASIAQHIHGSLHLASGEPLLQMVLADYASGYGPEVWLIQYSVEQEPEQGDYWTTRVLQPKYTQLWPPEKGQPRGLVEVSYPASPPLAGLIRAGDRNIARSVASAAGMQQVSAAILDGDIQKLNAVDLAAFFRACLGALVTPKARMEEAEVNKERGVGWFIQPPAQSRAPGTEVARPAGAPSLRHPN
jgi:hypothetical protein